MISRRKAGPLISRRRLIATGGLLAGSLAVGLSVSPVLQLRSRLQGVPVLGEPGWIVIAPDESITLYSTLVEMGQGVWTALAQIVGEELEADFARLRVEMAPSWRAYSQPVGFDTAGSSSVQRLFTTMRSIGATARHMLIETAAADWKVPASECRATNGVVVHEASNRKATYGALAARASDREPPATPPLKAREQWRFIGKSIRRVDGRGKVDGSARYAMDLRTPDVLVAAVAQAPFDGGKVVGIDRAAALASPGVIRLVELSDTVAVIARNYWSASRGLTQAGITWSPADGVDSAQLRTKLRQSAEGGSPSNASAPPTAGSGPTAGRVVRALYEAPLLAHAQMEPQNAIAQVNRLSAEIWAPAQSLDRMKEDVASALGLWTHAVTVHAPPLGGGFGRRLTSEAAVTAALIAKEVGARVQSVWSRSDDFLQDRFRPMSAVQFHATLDEQGRLSAFEAHVATLGKSRHGTLAEFPYAAAAIDVKGSSVSTPLRLGSWRSVDHSQTVFFRECFIDECAAAAGVDPLAYRRTLLAGKTRELRVLDAVAEMSRWGEGGRHLGLAFNDGFGSPCAQVIEVERTSGDTLRVKRVFVAVDCGTAINPDGVRAQLEGGVLMGLGAALYEEVAYENGALRHRNFDTYNVLRMKDAPALDVRILESPDVAIGGIGEVGVPPAAPALVNAVFSATGRRVRSLPLTRAGIAWA
jgi:isoquinoline 1-oxidoreductase subunit beta